MTHTAQIATVVLVEGASPGPWVLKCSDGKLYTAAERRFATVFPSEATARAWVLEQACLEGKAIRFQQHERPGGPNGTGPIVVR